MYLMQMKRKKKEKITEGSNEEILYRKALYWIVRISKVNNKSVRMVKI